MRPLVHHRLNATPSFSTRALGAGSRLTAADLERWTAAELTLWTKQNCPAVHKELVARGVEGKEQLVEEIVKVLCSAAIPLPLRARARTAVLGAARVCADSHCACPGARRHSAQGRNECCSKLDNAAARRIGGGAGGPDRLGRLEVPIDPPPGQPNSSARPVSRCDPSRIRPARAFHRFAPLFLFPRFAPQPFFKQRRHVCAQSSSLSSQPPPSGRREPRWMSVLLHRQLGRQARVVESTSRLWPF